MLQSSCWSTASAHESIPVSAIINFLPAMPGFIMSPDTRNGKERNHSNYLDLYLCGTRILGDSKIDL